MLDWLKKILGEAYTEEIGKAVSTEIGKGFVARTDFNALSTEKTSFQALMKERDAQLETLKNSTGDVEGLKKQIADLQTANTEKDKTHAAEIRTLKVNAAVDAALTAARAKNQKAVRALLDLEKAELADDGTIKGLSDQIKKLVGADDSKFMFDSDTKKTTMKGASPAETGKEDPDTRVDVSKMSYEELAAYMDANPDAKI